MITQVRDHGVFTASAPPSTIEGAKLRCAQLQAQKDALDHRLSPLLDKVQDGSATAEELALVPDLAEDTRIVAARLHHATVELRVIEEQQTRQEASTARSRFAFLVAEDRQQRAKFARLYRDCCITLGRLCAGVDEASALANASIGIAGMLPLDRNAVTEMSEDPNPLPTLLDNGLAPTVGFGWNLRIAVVPLKGK